MLTLRVVLVLLLAVAVGCDPVNTPAVSATVRVVDAVTGTPVPRARVLLLGIYNRPGPGTAHGDSSVYATADADGVYRVSFARAFLVASAAQAPGYLPARGKLVVSDPALAFTLSLRRARPTTVQTALYVDPLVRADPAFAHVPVERVARAPVVVEVDGCPQSTGQVLRDSYGLILSGARSSRDTAACDFWLVPSATDQPPTVVVAGGSGGVAPIFTPDYARSPLVDHDEAPARGYFRRYVLTGKEAGFFVRTRDGRHYGKYVFASAGSGFSASGTGDAYCRYRWEGSCIYQPNGSCNLAFNPDTGSLLLFLLGSIP